MFRHVSYLTTDVMRVSQPGSPSAPEDWSGALTYKIKIKCTFLAQRLDKQKYNFTDTKRCHIVEGEGGDDYRLSMTARRSQRWSGYGRTYDGQC